MRTSHYSALVSAFLALRPSSALDEKLSIPASFDGPPQYWDHNGAVSFENNRVVLSQKGTSLNGGSIWTKNPNTYDNWKVSTVVTIDPALNEPKDTLGGLAIWYSANPNTDGPVMGSSDRWDGFALILDNKESEIGSLRGHLNDGSTSFESIEHPAQQAFALCTIDYRTGPSEVAITIEHDHSKGVRVDVNGGLCFESDKVVFPKNFYLGVSVKSKDGYTIKSLGTTDIAHNVDTPPEEVKTTITSESRPAAGSDTQHLSLLKDEILSSIGLTHQKLESLNAGKDITGVQQKVEAIEQRLERIESLLEIFASKMGVLDNFKADSTNERKDDNLSGELEKLHIQIDNMNKALQDHTSTVVGSFSDKMSSVIDNGGPNIWIIFVLFILVNGALLVSYSVYKTRKSYHQKIL